MKIFILVSLMWVSALGLAKEREGMVDVDGGKIWYKVFYETNTASKIPLIVLHGGPGAPHNYLLPLKVLAAERPVIFYDQLGCGKSAAHDKRDDLWTIERFRDELVSLVDALGYKKVDFLGHSWGTSLAFEFYKVRPQYVNKMIFEGAFFSNKLWERDTAFLRRLLPDDVQAALDKCEKEESWEKEECVAAVDVFYHRHLNRQNPWPQDLLDTFNALSVEVYLEMNGPNEFSSTGVLAKYDVLDQLDIISVPVLFLGGQYDEAQPATVWEYASHIKGARLQIFPNSSHTPHLEEPEAFLKAVRDFL